MGCSAFSFVLGRWPGIAAEIAITSTREAEIQVDGQVKDTVDLSRFGTRQPQQLWSTGTGLITGQHTCNIINCGPGPVASEAIVVK
jgi:hypothetical protein